MEYATNAKMKMKVVMVQKDASGIVLIIVSLVMNAKKVITSMIQKVDAILVQKK
jgi:hypothetical protein